MGNPIHAIPPKAQPWARGVDSDLASIKAKLGILDTDISGIPALDKTVFAEFYGGQNIANGTSGRLELTTPVSVRFASSTGLYEVTVSIAGLVRDGAIFGGSFESSVTPYTINYDIPKYGVVSTAPVGQTSWFPFAASTSTVINTRPGVQDLNLYLYAVCTTSVNTAAYLSRARLSVKAV